MANDPSRRNVFLLAICQGIFMSLQSMAAATTPLAAYMLLGVDKTMATFPIFLMQLGIMLTTIPASLLMARVGRRAGFTVGALSGLVSGGVSVAAIYTRSFELLCLGAMLQGAAAAFAWYFRFAAADVATPAYRAKAISLVMAGGVVAGLLGPQTAKWTVDWLTPFTFAGIYVMVSVYSLLVMGVVQALRIPRLSAAEKAEGGRPLGEIVRQPTYIVALISSMCGYGVMTLIMSATPLAMMACGFKFADSATVVQFHVVAMFLPSFFTGHLISRFGALPIIITGALIQVGCAMTNLAGIDFMNFLIANVLVGLGWNFTYIGGTTLLTSTYRPAERAKVQASHDFAVYATTASAAGLSGVLQAQAGWTVINASALPLMALVMTAALWLMAYERRRAGLPAAAE